ncbi:MAG TPA: BglII/BstYI family type II restriction endonuclease [Chthoniobacterales bacterium]
MPAIFEKLKKRGFDVEVLHHAEAILLHDMPQALVELEGALLELQIPVLELVQGGGGEALVTQRLRRQLAELGWEKHNFVIKRTVDGIEKESRSHEIDHVKNFSRGTVALEIEWNNKDPFFDRDLENFKTLHAEGAVSVGGIITRGRSLHQKMRDILRQFALNEEIDSVQDLARFELEPTRRQTGLYETAAKSKGEFAAGWAHAFVADKFGEATTHWSKLEDRIRRGVGNPCPLVLIGIPDSVIVI